MRILKRILCFFYFVQAAGAAIALAFVLSPDFWERFARSYHPDQALPMAPGPLATFLLVVLFGANGLVFGMAFFTVLMGKRSARYWVILPSLLYLVAAVASLFRSPVSPVSALISGFVGVGGLALTWNSSWSKVPARQAPMPKNAGDGTSSLLNKAAQAVAVIGYLAAWWGCDLWMIRLGEPRPHGRLFLALVLGFLVTLVHELGHASIGLALQMRLRAFMAGPFEWRIREGKWTFKFNLAGLLTDAGATGVVPSTANQPRWHPLAMIAAGPAANLYTGLIAIGFAWACSVSGGDNLDYVLPAWPVCRIQFCCVHREHESDPHWKQLFRRRKDLSVALRWRVGRLPSRGCSGIVQPGDALATQGLSDRGHQEREPDHCEGTDGPSAPALRLQLLRRFGTVR